ncbi:hypothetical protein [Acinetobacter sp. YH12086]|uniref:hypothetical protein n=1 Tax=Acinetobacter sp. YH12086 TaxID=2601078 RepID=UPI0015D1C202|nr:hypothetical protein [Acinetobacter sp. YH12086]
MLKVSLKEKLNIAIRNVVYVSILFFLFGAFIKSDGPKFDANKFYELIKDTFSFCAAFVGPVIAYVLFNDWRQEHLEKKLETDSESIFKKLNDIYLKLFEVRMSICKQDTLNENEGLEINMTMELTTIELMRCRNHVQLLKNEDSRTDNFIKKANGIIDSLNEVNNEFYDIQNAYVSYHLLNKPYDYLSPMRTTTDKLKNNTNRINELNKLCKDLQVKNFQPT